jgi:hypothetical protein
MTHFSEQMHTLEIPEKQSVDYVLMGGFGVDLDLFGMNRATPNTGVLGTIEERVIESTTGKTRCKERNFLWQTRPTYLK